MFKFNCFDCKNEFDNSERYYTPQLDMEKVLCEKCYYKRHPEKEKLELTLLSIFCLFAVIFFLVYFITNGEILIF